MRSFLLQLLGVVALVAAISLCLDLGTSFDRDSWSYVAKAVAALILAAVGGFSLAIDEVVEEKDK